MTAEDGKRADVGQRTRPASGAESPAVLVAAAMGLALGVVGAAVAVVAGIARVMIRHGQKEQSREASRPRVDQ